ncbi:response regulator transcription factor [Actinotalea sp. BY-33]|uniref:Response regulator transcription factor n=1 Tax=Actinotalea soli TaxID=2819234 RepID=A0A939RUV4_9CELL|nr:response regulator transcription factor [Actinotalea soli]MBO1751750.1 response regulator transcription factor [Actinotalea soli]
MPPPSTTRPGHEPGGPWAPAPGIRDVDLGLTHGADVVVCDRDDVSGLLTAEVLRGAGHRVHVRDLADVLADPAAAPILLLGDPTAAGPAEETLAGVRRHAQGTHPTIMVITPTADPAVGAELLDAGADHVLPRPWSPRLLRAVVAAQLRRHHLTCGATAGLGAVTC